ncbi:MAG: metal-dependent hydrolase [Alphaproteobacteria bacterium]
MTASIQPRNVRFGIGDAPVRHWYEGDAVMTGIVDCFSALLPEGEKFFIRTIKHYEPSISDPDLQQEIRGFNAQEAYHSREHEDYNRGIRSLGYDVDLMEERARSALKGGKNHVTRLAITCAIEHLTTTFADVLLHNPQWFDRVPAAYRDLWFWHAVEELEHRAVAISVLNAATPKLANWKRYLIRTAAMNITLLTIALVWWRNLITYLQTDGIRIGPKTFFRAMWLLFGSPGLVRKSFWRLLSYYKFGFDPAKEHDKAFIAQWQERIAERTNGTGAT